MANFMKFDLDANNSMHLNVENVYRVGLGANTPTDDDVIFYYNVASAAGTAVWGVVVKFAAAITQKQANDLEILVRRVNKNQGGIINASDVVGVGAYLEGNVPMSDPSSTAQPT
tara:strand:- start:710 stop:1051 length:342 start_codon:yes stop_codon:yes gene_type:complete